MIRWLRSLFARRSLVRGNTFVGDVRVRIVPNDATKRVVIECCRFENCSVAPLE